ncbi:hypothetical protein FHL15_005917 [Xylaria flabelliformis]|uniref:Uncharacterized protein n=1 Tax=Xylaria flabelliformis TaxID=2512241 RepID=A0A553HZF4_9PEZI|nr:hypothetical protein FHL15_005917 [Xylaria flabelliformis]
MRKQEIANATSKLSSAKRKASRSSSSYPLLDATAESDVPHPPPSSSKRPASTVEVEDETEHQHTRKRARTGSKAKTIEHGRVLGSGYSSDASRSVGRRPMIDELEVKDETEHKHVHKRTRTEGKATAIEHEQTSGSDYSSDASDGDKSFFIIEREFHEDDPLEVMRQQKLFEEMREATDRWEKRRDLQCEAYRRFRLQRLPSPASSDAEDDDFPLDSDADEFGCTPLMLGLDNDDPRVEEVFGLAYTQKLERRNLRKPSRRPIAQDCPTSPNSPHRIQHPPFLVDDQEQDLTLKIDENSSKTSSTIERPLLRKAITSPQGLRQLPAQLQEISGGCRRQLVRTTVNEPEVIQVNANTVEEGTNDVLVKLRPAFKASFGCLVGIKGNVKNCEQDLDVIANLQELCDFDGEKKIGGV